MGQTPPHGVLRRAKAEDAGPGGGAARPRRADARPRSALRQRRAARAAVPARACELAMFGMGCFWGAERKLWQAKRRLHDGGRLRRRLHAEPDLPRGVHRPHRPQRGRPRGLRPEGHPATRRCSASSGRATTPPRACARATTWARSTARASTCTARRSGARPRPRATAYQRALDEAGYGPITTEIVDAPELLLRRGVPPAVPGEEPRRLLRPRRYRRRAARWASYRPREARVTALLTSGAPPPKTPREAAHRGAASSAREVRPLPPARPVSERARRPPPARPGRRGFGSLAPEGFVMLLARCCKALVRDGALTLIDAGGESTAWDAPAARPTSSSGLHDRSLHHRLVARPPPRPRRGVRGRHASPSRRATCTSCSTSARATWSEVVAPPQARAGRAARLGARPARDRARPRARRRARRGPVRLLPRPRSPRLLRLLLRPAHDAGGGAGGEEAAPREQAPAAARAEGARGRQRLGGARAPPGRGGRRRGHRASGCSEEALAVARRRAADGGARTGASPSTCARSATRAGTYDRVRLGRRARAPRRAALGRAPSRAPRSARGRRRRRRALRGRAAGPPTPPLLRGPGAPGRRSRISCRRSSARGSG